MRIIIWIAIAVAIGIVVAVDLRARRVAEICDGCKRRFYDAWSEVVFWQKRVMRAESCFSNLVKKEGEKALCVRCVEVRRMMRAVDTLRAKGNKFSTAVRDAEAKVDGTIRAQARKIGQVAKDLKD